MVSNLNDLIKASQKFEMPNDKVELIEKGRLEFISTFPLDSLQNLKVDDYCLGTNENSFSYWLEFKGILFGIGGGNASKFGIYKAKDGNYCEGAGPNKKLLKGKELEERFTKLKTDILKGLEYVKHDKVEIISELNSIVWNMVLLKIFCIYYPDKFLTIGDPEVIIECAKNIGINNIDLINKNSILINHLCRKKLNETPEFNNWEYEKMGELIWSTFREATKRDYYIIGSKYGAKAANDIFPEMLKRSVIATGFASNIDLSDLYNQNHSSIKEFLESHGEERKSINALKHFLSLRPGDWVAIKGDGSPKGTEGYLSILGIAEVIEKNGKVYEYEPNGLGHIINVKFHRAPILKELSLGGYGSTMHKLSNDEHIRTIFSMDYETSYYEELRKFLDQAETNELKTSHYQRNYLGLDVKVSFGQGNTARIPWISFLGEGQSTSNGIYPVYLLFKEFKKLILAYGISETNKPTLQWRIDSKVKTISQYFGESGVKPDRYGESYVYQVYDLNFELDSLRINSDLHELIDSYKLLLQNNEKIPKMKVISQSLQIRKANEDLRACGLRAADSLLIRFVSSVVSKPFVILTGLSGSGKTKLAQAFAKWICEDIDQYKIIPVGADWTNRESLFGYPNALESDKYILPDNGALSLILEAKKAENQSKPYFLILDEMNLSHVERYFADFLSAMESGEPIPLHNGVVDLHGIPSSIKLPKNLFVIGTVNIDETTYMFSPKVLDRANVIEFRVTQDEMSKYLGSSTKLDLESLNAEGASMGASFVEIASDKDLTPKNKNELNDELMKFFIELKKTGAEFGYRSASEINRFAAVVNKLEPTWAQWQIMDAAIMQKLLPKVHGSRKKLEPVLKKLAELCLHDASVFSDYIKDGNESIPLEKVKYPVSMEKIGRMYRSLIENSFTSYAEA